MYLPTFQSFVVQCEDEDSTIRRSVGTYLTKHTAYLVGRTDSSVKLLSGLRISPSFQLLGEQTYFFLQLRFGSVVVKPETKLYVLRLIFSHSLVAFN